MSNENLLSNIIPGNGPNLTTNNPDKVVYIGGSEFEDESWRLHVTGTHPDNNLNIQHRAELEEVGIDLTDAKIAAVQADGWTINQPYYASVLTDNRSDQNVPPALAGSMVGKTLEWDNSFWTHAETPWFTKASFHNSMFTDRAIMRRMQIINTDPDNGLAYPPIPEVGLILGARFADFEGTIGASMAITTADGLYGMIPFMVHAGPPAFKITPDSWAAQKTDGTVVGVHYMKGQTSDRLYVMGDAIVSGGANYICRVDGFQSPDFFVELAAGKWALQDHQSVLDKTMTTLTGEVMVDSSGRIMRGF